LPLEDNPVANLDIDQSLFSVKVNDIDGWVKRLLDLLHQVNVVIIIRGLNTLPYILREIRFTIGPKGFYPVSSFIVVNTIIDIIQREHGYKKLRRAKPILV